MVYPKSCEMRSGNEPGTAVMVSDLPVTFIDTRLSRHT